MKRFIFLFLVGMIWTPWTSAHITISGYVYDYLDRPIAGATVTALEYGQIVGGATTNAAGSYSMSVPETFNALRVEKTGYLTKEGNRRTNTFHLVAAGSLSGYVTRADGTTPIVGASIYVNSNLNSLYNRFGKSNAQGQFQIQRIDPGNYTIKAYHPDFRIDEVKSNVVITGPVSSCNFQALAFGKISGQVSYNQNPMAHVLITAKLNSDPTKEYDAFTDAGGLYSMREVPPGTYTVSAELRHYEFPPNNNVVVADAAVTENVNFTPSVSANGTLSGRITRSDGTTPVEDLSVHCEHVSNPQLRGFALTDSAGEYAIEGLQTGTYNLTVYLTNSIQTLQQTNISVVDGSITTVNLSTLDGAISGTVKDNADNPLANASVMAVTADFTLHLAITNASGEYRVDFLPAEIYAVTASTEDNWIPQTLSGVVVVANQETTGCNFTLQGGGQISGTITDALGPIHGASVIAISGLFDPVSSIAESLEDGTFTVSGLPSGSYLLIVKAEGHASDSTTGISVVAGQTTSGQNYILNTSGGSISGTVYANDGITPLAGALVSCSGDGISFADITTDANGDYVLPLLLPGSYAVSAFHEGYQLGELNSVTVTGQQQNSGNDFILSPAQ